MIVTYYTCFMVQTFTILELVLFRKLNLVKGGLKLVLVKTELPDLD